MQQCEISNVFRNIKYFQHTLLILWKVWKDMAALNHHSKGSRHPGHKNRSVFFTPNATISYWQARQSNAILPTLQILIGVYSPPFIQ